MAGVQRVLILSVKAGAGHFRAAQALEAAFAERYPELDVLHVDVLEYTNAAFRKGFKEGYETLAKDLPTVWGYLYDSLEEKPGNSRLKRLATLFDQMNARPLKKLVKKFDPDRIVCTHYVGAEVVCPRRRKGKLRAEVSVTLTDYDIHTMWIQQGVDDYFVATEEMAYALREKGIGDARAHVTGIPIVPEFTRDYPDKPTMRTRLGLDPEKRTVLVSAGGFGLMRADRTVAVLSDRLPEVQFLAVAGNAKKLEQQLRDVAADRPGRIHPFGFVDNMHELMAASDLAVAKCGGLTTSECLTMGLPMVIVKPIPGQEERNAVFLLERGAGVWAHTGANMIFKAERLLRDPDRLAAMQAAARAAARPDAAYRIADTIVQGTPAGAPDA
ncbi:MAG: MGDG synthase family glycosyltransferase [Planctomycetota bacterium]